MYDIKLWCKNRHKDCVYLFFEIRIKNRDMAQAHTERIREEILRHRSIGLSMIEISETLQISYNSVRELCKRYASCEKTQEGIKAALRPRYDLCGPQEKIWSPEIVSAALNLKQSHKRWGAPRLRITLAEELETEELPSIRTLERWFREHNLSKPPRQTGEPRIGRAKAVHNIWEVDAKENLVLQDGQEACYLTTVDEKSGAWLASPVFPL